MKKYDDQLLKFAITNNKLKMEIKLSDLVWLFRNSPDNVADDGERSDTHIILFRFSQTGILRVLRLPSLRFSDIANKRFSFSFFFSFPEGFHISEGAARQKESPCRHFVDISFVNVFLIALPRHFCRPSGAPGVRIPTFAAYTAQNRNIRYRFRRYGSLIR